MTQSKIEITPGFIARLNEISLRARSIVEGSLSGIHASHQKGSSLEFYEHKQYVPLDDPKAMDWRVYARKEKLYLKKYSDEINLKITILLDISGSMNYFSEPNTTKLQYASNLAAALLYLGFMQNDSFGIVFFNSGIVRSFPATTGAGYLKSLFSEIEKAVAFGHTDMLAAFRDYSFHIPGRGLVIIISDLMDSPQNILNTVKALTVMRNDTIVFQVLDRSERDLFSNSMYDIEDIETGDKLDLDVDMIKDDYIRLFDEKYERLRGGLASLKSDFVRFYTDENYEIPMLKYLAWRSRTVRQ